MMTTKRVSILLSCWGGDDYIKDYVDSLLRPGIREVCTLIAVDFPNSHKDAEFVRSHLHRFPDLIYLPQGISLSLYEAWNIGAAAAKTEFVGNLNLDDRVAEDYYKIGVQELDAAGADVFSSVALMTSKIGDWRNDVRRQTHFSETYLTGKRVIEYGLSDFVFLTGALPKKRNPPHCAPIWRRDLHDRFGWFDCKRYDFCADFEFWLRSAVGCARFILLNETKTLFFAAQGTASDRLMHPENALIIERWQETFPPVGFKETHLGRHHDLLHHCMNLNVMFSNPAYYWHLKDIVTIVVLAHDKPKLFIECLESIRSQDYSLLDCVIVLDEAELAVREVAEKMQAADGRFRVVQLGRRVERNYARNAGLSLAVGKWVAFVDGDDLLTRNSLSDRVAFSRKDPLSITFGGLEIFNSTGIVQTNAGRGSFDLSQVRNGWPHHCTLLIPVAYLREHSICYPAASSDPFTDPAGIAGEDVQFLINILRAKPGLQLRNCGAVVYRYRRHASSSYLRRQLSISKVLAMLEREFGLPTSRDVEYTKSFASRIFNLYCWCVINNAAPCEIFPHTEHLAGVIRPLVDTSLFTDAVRNFFFEYESVSGQKNAGGEEFSRNVKDILIRSLLNYDSGPSVSMSETVPNKLGAIGMSDIVHKPADFVGVDAPREFSRLLRFKNRHQGAECLLLCNGPSLKNIDFSRVNRDRFKIIGLNKIYLGFDMLGIRPDYIVAVNKKVIEQSADQFASIPIVKFISNRVDLSMFPENPMLYHLNTVNLPRPNQRFNKNIVEYVNEGWTVTHAALQIAYYMGFRSVYIVGMDHKFSQHVTGQENKESVIKGDDMDHFHPGYFGHGQKWDFPDLQNSEISYQAARKVYEQDGREIFDCTIDGACQVFEKRDVDSIYI